MILNKLRKEHNIDMYKLSELQFIQKSRNKRENFQIYTHDWFLRRIVILTLIYINKSFNTYLYQQINYNSLIFQLLYFNSYFNQDLNYTNTTNTF